MKTVLSVLVVMVLTLPVSAQTVETLPTTPAAQQVRALTVNASTDVRNVYGPIGFRPVWTRNARPTAQALSAIHLFETADAKGLNPADYGRGQWQPRIASLTSDAAIASFDVALTTTLTRYALDLGAGRVDPQSVKFQIEAKKFYVPAVVWQAANAADVNAALAQVEPQHEEYKRLLAALSTWRRIAVETANDTPLPAVQKLAVGNDYAALPQLAAKLRTFGDLAANAQVTGTKYEGAIVDAVKHFQNRHGLDADGVISAKTFAQLNVPASQRVAQIELALERARWMTEPAAERAIIVNIPEFKLRARDAQGEVTMRVVVGKTTSKTPVFDGDLRHVVFRPYWVVPPAIQRHEIAPKVAKDHGWLARNGYEVVGASGPVNAAMVEKIRTLRVQVRQKPGSSNSLGLVKFLFPNDNNVYLHDTPSQSHFARASRAYSHGCIRLAEPDALAAWVLRDKSEWTPEKVQKAMRGERDDIYVKVANPIAVVIKYETAVAQPNGDVHFFEDVYGHDVKLMAALNPAKDKVLLAQGGASTQVASK